MIGDKGCLSTNKEPLVIKRPYTWQAGRTLPDQYLQIAKETLPGVQQLENDKPGISDIMEGLKVLGVLIFVLLLGGFEPFAFIVALAAGVLMYLKSRYDRMLGNEMAYVLNGREFDWRTGTLDDIVAEVTDRVETADGYETVYRYYVYADGEKLYDPFIYQTRIGASEQGERPKFIPSGKPETWVHVNRAGLVTLGMPVVLLRFNVGHLTVVLPQNLENSRS